MAEWVRDDSKHWITPGGDPVWVCSNCGGGKHVFGIESMVSQPKVCPDCGEGMSNAVEVIMVDFPILEGKKRK